MCDTGQSEVGEDVRIALGRLEEALGRHEQDLCGVAGDPAEPSLQVLRRSVLLMREEADRLRAMLQDD